MFIVDIDQEILLYGKEKYGFQVVIIGENGVLPFEDSYFDIVHCSSVIEYVGIDKSKQWDLKDEDMFAKLLSINLEQSSDAVAKDDFSGDLAS